MIIILHSNSELQLDGAQAWSAQNRGQVHRAQVLQPEGGPHGAQGFQAPHGVAKGQRVH